MSQPLYGHFYVAFSVNFDHCLGVLRYMLETIPLRWVSNDIKWAESIFFEKDGKFTYQDAPVIADFPLSYESLTPYVTKVLDLSAPLEGAGLVVSLVEIKQGVVKVW